MEQENEHKTCAYAQDIIINIEDPEKPEKRRCEELVHGDTDYCIYHAPIAAKEGWKFAQELKNLYEKTKDKYHTDPLAREGAVFFDCQGFKFPEGSFNKLPREMEIPVLIGDAEVEGDVDFKKVEFRERVVFNGVVFRGRTDFEKAHFLKDVNFEQCHFPELEGPSCWFHNTVFAQATVFRNCKFEGETDLLGTLFLGRTTFSNIEIQNTLNFYLCVFAEETLFNKYYDHK